MFDAFGRLLSAVASGLDVPPFVVQSSLAVLLVSAICGTVGSLVVGNRMTFFSDALAHCALTGVALGALVSIFTVGEPMEALVPLVMVGFGIAVGLAIGYVRQRTTLSTDAVIGVFFAGAIGLGAVLFPLLRGRARQYNPEQFLFGSPLFVTPAELAYLLILAALTAALLLLRYNQIVFASFNPSLARSRRLPLRLYNYLFIVLLALIVNLSIRAVGMMLINALLIVPAATANNLARNLRQMFWYTVALSLFAGVVGLMLSFYQARLIDVEFGPSGLIVVLSVVLFFLSMAVGPAVRGRQPA